MRPTSSLIWRHVHWPQPLDAVQARSLLVHLAADSSRGPVVFETRAHEGKTTYLVAALRGQLTSLARIITDLVPEATVGATPPDRPPVTLATYVRISGSDLPLLTHQPEQSNRAILAALAAATGNQDELVFQVVVGRGLPPRLGDMVRDPTQSWVDALAHGYRKPSPEVRRRLEAKRSEPALAVMVYVGASAFAETRARYLMSQVLTALRTVQSPGTRLDLMRERAFTLDNPAMPPTRTPQLSCSEMLALLGWPVGQETAPGLPSPHPKPLRLTSRDIETTRIFATTTAPGEARPLGIAAEDALFHTVLTGPTGTGKSTVLLNLITADLAAGRGVVVIDPKSDLVRDVLERIPATREEDVVVLDPTDKRPVGLNPLQASGANRELVADGILTVFRDLFPSMFGPRTADVLHASLLTLMEIPGATLAWLPRLLTDQAFRNRHLQGLNDADDLGGFWTMYESLSVRQQAQFIGPVLSRLRQFLLRPALRRVLDQAEPKFDLAQVFTQNKILLVPLNTGLLGGPATRLLGSLLVGQLWQLTLARAKLPEAQRYPVSIYIDETQEFLRLGSDLADALARSRALGVAWHLAHQFHDQFTPETQAAIDANARNKIIFTLGPKDARDAANSTVALKTEDFMALDRFHIYAQLVRHGQPLPWASGKTLPPPPVTSDPIALLASSQDRWGGQPDSTIKDAKSPGSSPVPGPGPDEPIGRRRRQTP